MLKSINPLYRKLEPRNKWQKYFPKTNCNKKVLGKGYTDFGAEQMKEWATKYSWQVIEIAKHLKAGNLFKTLENVHQFIYKNFQYQPDYEVQHIQSPACAWKMREQGINCKGYSTIASSILQELGIKHFIRRVSYDGENYTHVFIAVPTNKGEIIIDGTLPQFNYTSNYLLKKDLKVMPTKLKYIGMNAPEENTSKLIDVIVEILSEKGVKNIDEIRKFLKSIPENEKINLSPFGIKFKEYVLPFIYNGVDENTVIKVTEKYYKGELDLHKNFIKGLNGFGGFGGFTGPSFGYNFGATNPGGTGNFGVDLNLGGSSTGISSGGSSWQSTVNTIVGAIGTLTDVGLSIYNAVNGNDNSNNTGVVPPNYQNTNYNSGANQSSPQYPSLPQYPSSQSGDKPFYKDPLIVGLGLTGIGGLIYIASKNK